MSYVSELADLIRREVPQHLVPTEHSDELFTLYALLALAMGEKVTRQEVHDAWTAWMDLRGEDHPSMVPFTSLDAATRDEDQPFVDAIVRALDRRES